MEPTTGSLASHFPTRRRIFGTPGVDSDALVKQAQSELKLAEQAKKTVFRFDFDLSGELQDAPTKKKKNKKKKKKSKTKSVAVETAAVGGDSEVDGAIKPVVATTASAKAPVPAAKPTVTPPASTLPTAAKAVTEKKKKKSKVPASTAPKEPSPPVEPAGFMKLRKPTSSDSEVMKMQLRYGRGKRNVAAIAQREKKKKEQQESGEAASGSVGSGFQFNFFS